MMPRVGMVAAKQLQHGLSMLEVTMVLVIASLMSWAVFSAYVTFDRDRERAMAKATAQQMQTALRAFAMRHGRLPCPDTAGNGYETAGCPAATQVGGYPYLSVGLDLPPQLQQVRYAVFRRANANPADDADLAVALERTGDEPGDVHHLDVTDLVAALNNASAWFADDSGLEQQPHLTGDGGVAGSVACGADVVATVAYWLILPMRDADGDGDVFDFPHSTTGLCAASPSTPLQANADDIVVAESPLQLAGWLRRSMP